MSPQECCRHPELLLSEHDQVQPDLLAIRMERLDIYQGHIIHGLPDIVVEIFSPSKPSYDTVEKRRLYAAAGVPEYWIVHPDVPRMTILRLTGADYEAVSEEAGRLRSRAIIDFEIEPAALFAKLPEG